MFFSIVIPTYNRAHLIETTVKSLLSQSFGDFEIIIIDDGSADNTEEIIQQLHSEKIVYYKIENKGVAHARNLGIQKAKGKYIGFLDSDDKVKPNHLQTAYEYLSKNPQTQILHLNFIWMKEDGAIIRENKLPQNMPGDIFKGNTLHVNCIFILNEVAKQNLFNESRDLMFAEDWDFFIKLAVKYPIKIINAPTAFLVDHKDRSMRNFDLPVWEKRRDAITLSLLNDPVVYQNFSDKIKGVHARMNSLIALNSILTGKKKTGVKFYIKSITENPQELFRRRTLAIIKHLLNPSRQKFR